MPYIARTSHLPGYNLVPRASGDPLRIRTGTGHLDVCKDTEHAGACHGSTYPPSDAGADGGQAQDQRRPGQQVSS